MLHGKVDILANPIVVANFGNKLVGNFIGIAIKNSKPRNICLFAELVKKLGKLIVAIDILTVASCVLRNECELLAAKCLKILCLGNNIFHGAGTEATANGRNCTVCATVVASLGNLKICRIFGSGEHSVTAKANTVFILKRGIFLTLKHLTNRFYNVVNASNTKHCINLGKFVKNIVTISLRKATRNNKATEISVFLKVSNIQNVFNGFFFSRFNKSASVYNNNVCLGLVRSYLIARNNELMEHNLSVELIFGTTE